MPALSQKLDRLFSSAPLLPYDARSRLVIMSDCHRGQGGAADNFLPNSTIFQGALEYYYDRGFTYIELGDGDELWENRCLRTIVQTHRRAFDLLRQFHEKGRLYMLYGNHDMIKRRLGFTQAGCTKKDEASDGSELFLRHVPVSEGLILENKHSSLRLYLTHGHQGSLIDDELWMLGRFLVRHVWKPLETFGLKAPAGTVRSGSLVEKAEKNLCAYAAGRGRILIAGHTHRPVFARPGECPYFNDGSCIQPQYITALEIENDMISLVRWSISANPKRLLFISREVLNGPRRLDEYM